MPFDSGRLCILRSSAIFQQDALADHSPFLSCLKVPASPNEALSSFHTTQRRALREKVRHQSALLPQNIICGFCERGLTQQVWN